jgi:hypothetical protein
MTAPDPFLYIMEPLIWAIGVQLGVIAVLWTIREVLACWPNKRKRGVAARQRGRRSE